MTTPSARSEVHAGLEGVIAAASAVSFVDGKEGRLLYRGYDIHDLAAHSTFEQVVYLLWRGELPTRPQLEELNGALTEARALPDGVTRLIDGLPVGADPMDVLRTATSALAFYDPDPDDLSPAAGLDKGMRLVARFPTIIAAFHRCRRGKAVVPPDRHLGHAANFLAMLNGTVPTPEVARALDLALILHADHELNASTFSARVTAATLSDMYSAVTSAIGTLKGPLHGGANEAVMALLQEIRSEDRVEQVIREKLNRKEKIPGFGHRVYRTEDPRVRHLRRLSLQLGQAIGEPLWAALTGRVHEVVWREKHIYANVDLYSASTYHAMGIPTDLFTPVFAISRISGWTAHILEQYADNRLIRPLAEYTGPLRREYVPLEAR